MSFQPQKVCIHVLMIASQFPRQIGRQVSHFRLGDARDTQVFHKYVRRFQNQRARPLGIFARKDQGY